MPDAIPCPEPTPNILRIAAFADGNSGGNPAGVHLADKLPEPEEMQRIATEVGYSETAFAAPVAEGWRVRYFSPEGEVPFCGHATIALGAALALRHGDGRFALKLNEADISVTGWHEGASMAAALDSPPTRSTAADEALVQEALLLFGYSQEDLDPSLPPALIHAGANTHLALALRTREALAAMRYDLDAGRVFMRRNDLITVLLAWIETPRQFHTRNPFASGGVYEDPATGASTAALGGYLRDLEWPHGGSIDVIQGEDMGMRSLLHAEISDLPGGSIRVSGRARLL